MIEQFVHLWIWASPWGIWRHPSLDQWSHVTSMECATSKRTVSITSYYPVFMPGGDHCCVPQCTSDRREKKELLVLFYILPKDCWQRSGFTRSSEMLDPTFSFHVIVVCAPDISQTTSIAKDGKLKLLSWRKTLCLTFLRGRRTTCRQESASSQRKKPCDHSLGLLAIIDGWGGEV